MVFKKEYSRDIDLLVEGFWAESIEYGVFKKMGLKNKLPIPIIFYVNKGLVEIWENKSSFLALVKALKIKAKQSATNYQKFFQEYDKKLIKLQTYFKNNKLTSKKEFLKVLKLIKETGTLFNFWYYVAKEVGFVKGLKTEALAKREKDSFYDQSDKFIRTSLRKLFPQTKNRETVVTPLDFKKFPNLRVLQERMKNFVFIPGHYFKTETLSEFKQKNTQYIFQEEKVSLVDNSFKGQIACTGRIKGKVRILRLKNEIKYFKNQEILVAPMTTPEYLPAMKKAAGFITDEGGITCHAAIIARELKKPCVIGTKIATSILRDGDIIELDADRGIVKIL